MIDLRCACLMLLPLVAAAGQERPTVTPGARVRVTTTRGKVAGTLEAVDSASILLRRDNGTTAALARSSTTRVELSAGPGMCSPPNRGTCVVVGTLGGALIGVGLGAMMISTRTCGENDLCGIEYLLTVPLGALVGGLAGASLDGERWRPAEWPVVVGVTPNMPGAMRVGGGVRIGVHLSL